MSLRSIRKRLRWDVGRRNGIDVRPLVIHHVAFVGGLRKVGVRGLLDHAMRGCNGPAATSGPDRVLPS